MFVRTLVVGRKRGREPLFPELKELLFCSSCSVILGMTVNNGTCSVRWLQDPWAAPSPGQPWYEAGRAHAAASPRDTGLGSALGSREGWIVAALPQLWEGSFSGLVMALRLRSLQCLPSLSCSGLFSRPAPQLRGDSHQTLTGS